MKLYLETRGHHAIMVLEVDEHLRSEQLEKIKQQQDVYKVRWISRGEEKCKCEVV